MSHDILKIGETLGCGHAPDTPEMKAFADFLAASFNSKMNGDAMREAVVWSLGIATKEGAAVPETWQHVANEWADMATSGIQAVRNIIDGIETPEAVLANMNFCYSHCAEVQSRAKATPPAVMPAGEYVLSKTLEVASNESVEDAVRRGIDDGSVMPAAPSDAVRKALERLVHDIRDLADNSHGVIGLHKNGDDAPWSELTEGGRYDDWLGLALEQADAALSQTMQPQAEPAAGEQAGAVAQCPNCKGTRAPSPLDPDWCGRCECAAREQGDA